MSMQDDLSAIIGKIVENPEFAGMLNDIKGGGGSGGDIASEMRAALPNVLEMLSPMLGEGENKKSTAEPASSTAVAPKRFDSSRAEKLLYALKPYLSRERGEIINKCVSVMQMTDVMGTLGGLDGIIGKRNGG